MSFKLALVKRIFFITNYKHGNDEKVFDKLISDCYNVFGNLIGGNNIVFNINRVIKNHINNMNNQLLRRARREVIVATTNF